MKLILSGGYLIFEPLRYGIKWVLQISYGVGLATCLREASLASLGAGGALLLGQFLRYPGVRFIMIHLVFCVLQCCMSLYTLYCPSNSAQRRDVQTSKPPSIVSVEKLSPPVWHGADCEQQRLGLANLGLPNPRGLKRMRGLQWPQCVCVCVWTFEPATINNSLVDPILPTFSSPRIPSNNLSNGYVWKWGIPPIIAI